MISLEEIQFCRVYQSHYSFILRKLNLSLLWYGNIIININSVQFFFSKTFSFIFNTFNYRRKVYRNKKNKHLQVWYKCHNVKSKDKLWKAKTISTWLKKLNSLVGIATFKLEQLLQVCNLIVKSKLKTL